MRFIQRLCLFLILALFASAQDEPAYEDSIEDEQYGFAPKRSDPKGPKPMTQSARGGTGAGARVKHPEFYEAREKHSRGENTNHHEELREQHKSFQMMRRTKQKLGEEL